jgi:hypothetical protein
MRAEHLADAALAEHPRDFAVVESFADQFARLRRWGQDSLSGAGCRADAAG